MGKTSLFFICILTGLCSCTQFPPDQLDLEELAYRLEKNKTLLERYTPVFVVENPREQYNRIGTVKARYRNEREELYIQPDQAIIYAEERVFRTDQGQYTNLIYRIHFEQVPSGIWPLYLGAGENVGLLVIITLNEQHQPILSSIVHTCGCYLAFIPTSLPAALCLTRKLAFNTPGGLWRDPAQSPALSSRRSYPTQTDGSAAGWLPSGQGSLVIP